MTSFLNPSPTPTTDTRALQEIDSRNKSFANKDFVKNIAWLNNSVDTLSNWSQKLQAGVDQANSNIFEQLSGVFSDLFIMFAGGEPTGFDFGDLKYIIQGLGAMLGINPETPFPFNLIEGVQHLFDTYIMPLPQLTDAIFDTIEAWAEELGFTDEAVAAMEEFSNAIVTTYNDWDDVMQGIQTAFVDLFRALGFGNNFLSLNWLLDIMNQLYLDISNFIAGPQQILMYALSDIVVFLFKGLTNIVRLVDPYTIMTALGLDFLGPQLAIAVSNDYQDWDLDIDPDIGWVFDATVSYDASAGSFKTSGNSTNKALLPESFQACAPDEILSISGVFYWDGIPTDTENLGLRLGFYNDGAFVSDYEVWLPAGHGATGGWQMIGDRVTVPGGVNGYRLGCFVSLYVTSGTVWVDGFSVTKQTSIGEAIYSLISMFLPQNIWQNFLNVVAGVEDATWQAVAEFIRDIEGISNFVQKVLGGTATVDDLAALVQSFFSPWNPPSVVGVGQLANVVQNLIFNPIFETAESLVGEAIWAWDTASHAAIGGSATVAADLNTNVKSLLSNPVLAVLGDSISASVWTKWEDLTHTGDPISLVLNLYNSADELIDEVTLEAANIVGATSDWVQLTGEHLIEDATVAYTRLRCDVSELATAGQVWFDDVSLTKPLATLNLPSTNILDALGGEAGNISSAFQSFIDTAIQGFDTTITEGGNTLTALASTWSNVIGSWLGFNAASPTPNPGSQIGVIRSNLDTRSVTKPAYDSLDPTSDPVFDISKLINTTPLPTVPVVQGTSAMGFITTPDGGIKDGIAWLGYPAGGNFNNIDALYLNVYQMDPATGELTFLWTSGDISAGLPDNTTPQWNFFDIPDEDDLITAQGHWYAIEMTIVGAGQFNVLGVTSTIPQNETNYPYTIAARRTGLSPSGGVQETPPATIEEPDWTANTPWFALSGTAGEMTYPPSQYVFGSSDTFDIPDWANTFDIFLFGGGGGGVNGAYLLGGYGGGAGGCWATRLTRGDGEEDDFPSTTTEMTISVGGGGYPNGGAGGSTSIAITGWTSSPASIYGGAYGVGQVNGAGGGIGGGGGSATVSGITIYQGAGQGAPQFNGNWPGGGGAGGNAGYIGSYIYGGWGAGGCVVIRCYP